MIMLYRFIYSHKLAAHLDNKDEDPAENNVYPLPASEESSSYRLMLLIMKNRAGRDTAAECLDLVAGRLDPKGHRRMGRA